MQSDRPGSVHDQVPLWTLGERRGSYEAFRYMPDGKRQRRTLGTSSEQEALTVLGDMNDEVLAGSVPTVASCFALYKHHKELKGKWTQSQQRALDRVCAQIGELTPAQVSFHMTENMGEARLATGLARDTVRLEMAYLRASLRFAAKVGAIKKAPFVAVPKGGNVRERWLDENELQRLIEGAVELHVKLFIILAVTTAARPSHILGLTWDRINFDNLYVDFRDGSESNKIRSRVPINETCLKHLTVAKELSRTPYVIEFNGRGGFGRIYKGIIEAARRAGIKGVSPYVLRHTAGTRMAMAGVPMSDIAAYMGHKYLATTMKHYLHYSPSHLRKAASALEIGPRGAGSDADQSRERL